MTSGDRIRGVLRMGLVAVAGFGVLIFGVALIVLPGPAVLVIPLGLAILATEFPWARTVLEWIRQRLRRLQARVRQAFRRDGAVSAPASMPKTREPTLAAGDA
jgi:uncharacterized protein (TIGR02611 family)